MIATKEFRLLAPLSNAVRTIIKKPVAHVLDYRTVCGIFFIFNENMTFLGKTFFCRSLSLSLSISGLTAAQQGAIIVGSTRTPKNKQGMEGPSPAGAVLRKGLVHRKGRRRRV
jgi:hypothetical protein